MEHSVCGDGLFCETMWNELEDIAAIASSAFCRYKNLAPREAMNKLRFWVVLLFLTCAPFSTRADTVDQSFTGPITEGASINECCAFIGQTYTAGLSGTLAAVSLDVVETPGSSFPLDAQIRTVSGGLPTTTVLGETITT